MTVVLHKVTLDESMATSTGSINWEFSEQIKKCVHLFQNLRDCRRSTICRVSILGLVLLIVLVSRTLLVKKRNVSYLPRKHCTSTRYGSTYSGIYLPDPKTLKQMLPRNSVIYVTGRDKDVDFEVELVRLTGAVVHVFYLKGEESIDKTNIFNSAVQENTDTLKGGSIRIHRWNKANAGSYSTGKGTISNSYLSDSMQQFGHSTIDLLKINANDVAIDMLKQIFEIGIFPRIIIIPSEMMKRRKSDRNTYSITNKLSPFGYKILYHLNGGAYVAFVLDGCDLLTQRAKQISLHSGFVNIQFFNEGFLNMTKSWICNVRSLNGVLPATLFVASDLLSYNALLDFKFTNVNVIYEDYRTPVNMDYGQTTYFSFTHYRTEIVLNLLENNINVWSTEADAVWYASPFDEMDPIVEMYIANNNPKDPQVSVGMIYLKATEDVIQLWKKLLAFRINNPDKEEQSHLTVLVRETNALVEWLPSLEYISGLWYTIKEYRTGKEKVIQNNFIVSNQAKEERAKSYGQYFLQDDGTCKKNVKQDL